VLQCSRAPQKIDQAEMQRPKVKQGDTYLANARLKGVEANGSGLSQLQKDKYCARVQVQRCFRLTVLVLEMHTTRQHKSRD
jgi:hypothetical protein